MKCPMCSHKLKENHVLKGTCDNCHHWDDDDVGCHIEKKINKFENNFFKQFELGTERYCPFHQLKE